MLETVYRRLHVCGLLLWSTHSSKRGSVVMYAMKFHIKEEQQL